MNRTLLRYTLPLALMLGSVGCGESPQQGSAPPPAAPQATTAPAPTPVERSPLAAPAQSAVEVRQPEGITPPPPPATASSSAAPAAKATTTAPATKPTVATTKGTLLKSSELKEKPFIDAKTLATLPSQSAVNILERNGGWFRVQTPTQSGWVRMLNVKVTEGAQNLGSGTDLTQAATLATGRAGSGNIVSTSGLRGLSEEELRSAKPDYTQFDKLNGYGVDKAAASSYAKANGLTSRSVQYLPAPAK